MTGSQPWMKFYPRDWRGDQALRAVSIAARGLWMEMLCIMHEASPYGHLVLGGHAVSNDVLARMSGLGADQCCELIAELESAGVFSRTRKGVIYSRRMIKDRSRAEKGRKSVNRRWVQVPDPVEEKTAPNRNPNREPTTQKPEARYQKERKKKVTAPGGAAPLAFEGKVIRLTQADFDQWGRAYPDVDLAACLQARDDWLVSDADDRTRKRWFIATSNHLANLQQRATAAKKAPGYDIERITV